MDKLSKISYSKTITDGCAVKFRGSKIIRASKASDKIIGVYKSERPVEMRLLTQDGQWIRWTVTIPAGVQTKGELLISVKEK